jgi:hypothetical protein
VEVASRRLHVAEAARLFVVLQVELAAEAGHDGGRPDLEGILESILWIRFGRNLRIQLQKGHSLFCKYCFCGL